METLHYKAPKHLLGGEGRRAFESSTNLQSCIKKNPYPTSNLSSHQIKLFLLILAHMILWLKLSLDKKIHALHPGRTKLRKVQKRIGVNLLLFCEGCTNTMGSPALWCLMKLCQEKGLDSACFHWDERGPVQFTFVQHGGR